MVLSSIKQFIFPTKELFSELPNFPSFKPLELADQDLINSLTKQFSLYSDFAFSNLWSWNTNDSCRLSQLNGNLVILFPDPHTTKHFLSLVGIDSVKESIATLLDYTENTPNLSDHLGFVPHEVVSELITERGAPMFNCTEDRDNSDYIYNLSTLISLEGPRYKAKRNLVRRFAKDYSDANLVDLDLTDPAIRSDILNLLHQCHKRRQGSQKDYYLQHEAIACNRLLKQVERFNLLATGLYVGDKLVAASIDELTANNCALSHFFKVDLTYRGAYDTLNKHTAEKLAGLGVTRWNWVEDLGIETLRRSKLSYGPEQLLRTYSITRA